MVKNIGSVGVKDLVCLLAVEERRCAICSTVRKKKSALEQ